MKVLLFGLMYSQWTLHFVQNFLLANHCEVWMVNRNNKKEEYRKYIELYKRLGVHFIDVPDIVHELYDKRNKKSFLKNMHAHFHQLKSIIRSGPYDLINLHYVSSTNLIYTYIIKKCMKTKLILSYWGSDLLRADKNRLSLMGLFVRAADYITFDNKDLEIKFKEVYGRAAKMPAETVLFGLPVLDKIHEKCRDGMSESIRKMWNIPDGKTVIAIGYSGTKEHQHVKVLKAVGKLEDQYKERIVLLLQMTYSGAEDYKKQVLYEAEKTGCEYIGIQRFLTDDEIAELRIITDIFINAQTTDAFSGSVCENLYAGTLLMNAQWLCYQEFKDYDFKYMEFEDIHQIGQLIIRAFEQETDVSQNKDLIWRLRSWECCGPRWLKVYKNVVKPG